MTRLRECRENAKLSQKYVAISLGVAAPSVANWESGKTNPTLENLMQLADLYNVTIDYMVGRAEKNELVLSDDETILLERYRTLDEEDKELLRSDALRMMRESARGTGIASTTAG